MAALYKALKVGLCLFVFMLGAGAYLFFCYHHALVLIKAPGRGSFHRITLFKNAERSALYFEEREVVSFDGDGKYKHSTLISFFGLPDLKNPPVLEVEVDTGSGKRILSCDFPFLSERCDLEIAVTPSGLSCETCTYT